MSPNCVILVFLGDISHVVAHFALNLQVNSCLSAEALDRRGFLSVWGRLILGLERPAAASFASLSASSLPLTLLCPDIHLIVSSHPTALMAEHRDPRRCCPEDALGHGRVVTRDWLSVYSETLLLTMAGVLFRTQRARMAPTISASYMLCSSELPMKNWSNFNGQALSFL